MSVYGDNLESIGRTPLVRINRLTSGLKATVLAKATLRSTPTARFGEALATFGSEPLRIPCQSSLQAAHMASILPELLSHPEKLAGRSRTRGS